MKKTLIYSAPELDVLEYETINCLAASPTSDGIEDATYGDNFDNWS